MIKNRARIGRRRGLKLLAKLGRVKMALERALQPRAIPLELAAHEIRALMPHAGEKRVLETVEVQRSVHLGAHGEKRQILGLDHAERHPLERKIGHRIDLPVLQQPELLSAKVHARKPAALGPRLRRVLRDDFEAGGLPALLAWLGHPVSPLRRISYAW